MGRGITLPLSEGSTVSEPAIFGAVVIVVSVPIGSALSEGLKPYHEVNVPSITVTELFPALLLSISELTRPTTVSFVSLPRRITVSKY